MFQTKFVEKIKTHVLYSKNPSSENRGVYETKWKNSVEPDRAQMKIGQARLA